MRRIPFPSLIGLPGSVPLVFSLACVVAALCSSAFWQATPQEQKAEPEQAQRRREVLEEKACGLKDVDYWVKTDKKQHPTPDPPPDKALIYVVRSSSMQGWMLQSKLAVDGRWMGVNRDMTYFLFTLDPGEHYFCSQVGNRSVLVLAVEAGRDLLPGTKTDWSNYDAEGWQRGRPARCCDRQEGIGKTIPERLRREEIEGSTLARNTPTRIDCLHPRSSFMLQLIGRAWKYTERTAIASGGAVFRYEDLLEASHHLASVLLDGRDDLAEAPVAFMVPPGFDYVRTQWAIWRAGGIAVPLCLSHPTPALQYVLEDTASRTLVISPGHAAGFAELARPRNIRLVVLSSEGPASLAPLPEIGPFRRAMILYTSGTTSRPKGVVITHANLEAQISTLVQAWGWREDDCTLCVLPLHHVHGIVNVVSCALWAGARCEFLPEFSPADVFASFDEGRVNVFMAVPTIYHKLIAAWEKLPGDRQRSLSQKMRNFRLMVSGSAALPVSVLERWRAISYHTLLERYGMTEIGMALSNPLDGERRPGFVGTPLPGVEIRLADDSGNYVPDGEPGEILVRGKNVFLEYWNRPEATREAFGPEGWFRTGDVAVVERGYYRILGRNSVDIIKSAGYKISALEIEEALRLHSAVRDCSVVGIENEEWGEVVAAVVVPRESGADLEEIDRWLRSQLPSYKIPRRWVIAEALPRNAMGKVTKNELKSLFSG